MGVAMKTGNLRLALVLATALSAVPAIAGEAETDRKADTAATRSEPALEQQFQDPPQSARPRVWWHWLNGNISKDGIAKDMAWMKRVGIGGLQNFDVNMQMPQVVPKRMAYMTPEWKDAFRFAASEADRLGLELAIASSPGWSETGGPWVKPEDGLKKLVWSEMEVAGGTPFAGRLAPPPGATGPFQGLTTKVGLGAMMGDSGAPVPQHYADVAVLAYPVAPATPPVAVRVSATDGTAIDAGKLADGDLSSIVELARAGDAVPSLTYCYAAPQTIRSLTLYLAGAGNFFGSNVATRLEASTDGKTWRTVIDVPASQLPNTLSFAPVTARWFRVVFPARSGGGGGAGIGAGMGDGVDMSPLAAIMGSMSGGPAPVRIGELRLSSEARIDRAEAKAGYSLEHDYYALSQGVPEAQGVAPGQVIDLTARMRPDGSLDWAPPKGRWRVLRLGYSLLGTTNHPATPEATGLEVDKFDGAAVRRYIEHYLGMYRDAAGADMLGRRGVRALLTDSIEVGAANWTPQMVAQFKRLRGYDPVPWLPAITGTIVGSRTESDRFLYDYRRTLADLMASEHYGTIATVAHENGLKVYGEALEDNRPSLGDDMAMRRHADVPMSAMWTYPRGGRPGATYIADMKGAASVAHVNGQNLTAAESLTSSMSPWAHGPAELKRVIDLEFVTGINRPVIHTSVHVPNDEKKPGLSLFVNGQYFNRHESWGELARPWIDYIARNSLMLQQGRNVADVAYFYGEEAPITGLYGREAVADAPKTNAYDFVNADALVDALSNDGAELVSAGGARYRALYLGGSSRMMTLATLRRIAALAEGGATVIGPKPQGNPSLAGDADEFRALTARLWPAGGRAQVGKGRVIASTDIEAALVQAGVAPDFRFSGGQADSQIPFVHRKLADGDSYFLNNRKDRAETIEARFRVTGKVPQLWHAEDGTSEPVSYRTEGGETVINLTLAPEDAVHVVFRKPAQADSLMLRKLVPTERGRVSGPWHVAFEAGRGAPASASLAELAPLNENADAGIKYFSGIATYANVFTTPKGWKPGQPLWIDLGEAREVAEVTVNGKLAGHAWHAPYRVDVSKVARPGRNTLQVRVANLWVNRMIGDVQPGAKRITWTGLPTYTAKAPLRRSGLIGPVTILGQ